MAIWLPVLKAALPYVGNIVAAAVPVFTSRKEHDASAELMARQIAELQEAATLNAEALKTLAAQVEKTLTALDAGETEQSQRMAAMQETLARCDSMATLAQAQVTRLEGTAAALQSRIESVEQRSPQSRHHEQLIGAMALLALILAGVALVI